MGKFIEWWIVCLHYRQWEYLSEQNIKIIAFMELTFLMYVGWEETENR